MAGAIEFTQIDSLAWRRAKCLVKLSIAALLAR
jgi:hypothetical protein